MSAYHHDCLLFACAQVASIRPGPHQGPERTALPCDDLGRETGVAQLGERSLRPAQIGVDEEQPATGP